MGEKCCVVMSVRALRLHRCHTIFDQRAGNMKACISDPLQVPHPQPHP